MKGAVSTYQGRGLIADPIHQYILYTRPDVIPGESTEQDLIDTPWVPLIEELLRVSGLLHDVGHGPFGHFFDDNFLVDFDLTHERLGQRIIREELAEILKDLRRSPSGTFDAGE